jgi:histidyl-tRNA synthetase
VSARLQAPRGTFDVLPGDSARRARIESTARGLLEAAGYRRIETPAFEATELFARGVGEATDIVQKEMYSFDDGGGRSLTLRPEGTAPVCRAYLEHGMHKLPQPVRLWYSSSFFRRERAQAGRFRQFWQVGAEVIGSDEPALDAETILLLAALLEAVGVRGARLRLGSLGSASTRAAYREELAAHLRAHEGDLSEEVRARIDLNPLRAFDADHAGTRRVMATAPRLFDRLSGDDAEHFAQVRALLDDAGQSYEVDTALVRGLDYYTRTLYEFTSDELGAQSGVGGGGRYDGLVEQLGGAATPGVGWAAGIERMLLAGGDSEPTAPAADLLVAPGDGRSRLLASRLAREARSAGLTAELEAGGRSRKGQLKHADRVGARWVALVDDGSVALKDMVSGEQQEIAPGDLVAAVTERAG